MSRRKNHTDEYFRKRLRDYRASPPEEVWTGISSELNREKRKRRILAFRRIAASIAVLLSLGVAFLLLKQGLDNKAGEAEFAADSGKHVTSPENLSPVIVEEPAKETEPGPGETTRNTELAGMIRPAETVREAGADQDIGPVAVIPASVPGETSPLSYIRGIEADLPVHNGPETRRLVVQTRSRYTEIRADEEIETFPDLKEEDMKSFDKWVIGTRVSPLYSYRSVGAAGDPTVDQINRAEEGMIAYAGGVNINFLPVRRLALQSGLYYSRMGLKVKDALDTRGKNLAAAITETAGSFMASNSSGTIPYLYSEQSVGSLDYTGLGDAYNNSPADGGDIIQQFDYLELPVIVRYRVIDKKFGFDLLGGLSTNFLVGRNSYLQQQDGEKEYLGLTGNLKTVSCSSVLGIGLGYAITSDLDFNFEPTFRYYINSINKFSALKSHPYSIGFYTGISYRF